MIGKSDYSVFPKETADAFTRDDSLVLDCFCTKEFLNPTKHKEDSVFWNSVKYPVIFLNGDTGVAGEGTFIKFKIDSAWNTQN